IPTRLCQEVWILSGYAEHNLAVRRILRFACNELLSGSSLGARPLWLLFLVNAVASLHAQVPAGGVGSGDGPAAEINVLDQNVDLPHTGSDARTKKAEPEKWNLYFQATSIAQYHPRFASPYAGEFSLVNHREAEVSLTSTLFFGWQLARNARFYV